MHFLAARLRISLTQGAIRELSRAGADEVPSMSAPMEMGSALAKRADAEELPKTRKAVVEDDILSMSAGHEGSVAVASQAALATDTDAILAAFKANFERDMQGNLPTMVSRSLAVRLAPIEQKQAKLEQEAQQLRHDINRLQETQTRHSSDTQIADLIAAVKALSTCTGQWGDPLGLLFSPRFGCPRRQLAQGYGAASGWRVPGVGPLVDKREQVLLILRPFEVDRQHKRYLWAEASWNAIPRPHHAVGGGFFVCARRIDRRADLALARVAVGRPQDRVGARGDDREPCALRALRIH